ncbi:uncharacterized protein LOC106666394 [Cimex lectularius]|uniref:Uncharacterized protein n=1 Tax=Cimex lectularius TaxID=79782 RepID=A0A8I6SG12_CIMLE|nr:uncharacterized protein LOC106666394 [Cimex lectularius]
MNKGGLSDSRYYPQIALGRYYMHGYIAASQVECYPGSGVRGNFAQSSKRQTKPTCCPIKAGKTKGCSFYNICQAQLIMFSLCENWSKLLGLLDWMYPSVVFFTKATMNVELEREIQPTCC